MDDITQNPAPNGQPTSTLYRFYLRHGLCLNHNECSVQGIELSKVARERQLPHIRVRERVGGMTIKARLYPEDFLSEWLARYTQALATRADDQPSAPKPAANA